MGDMGYTGNFTQRYRYARFSNHDVASIRGKQRIAQLLARQFVRGCQLAARHMKDVGICNSLRSWFVGEDNLSVSATRKTAVFKPSSVVSRSAVSLR